MFNNKKTVFLYSEEQKHFLIVFLLFSHGCF